MPTKPAAQTPQPPQSDVARLADAIDRLADGLTAQTTELRTVDKRRADQMSNLTVIAEDTQKIAHGTRRTSRVMVGLMVGKLATLMLILSAVFPGVPFLRIHEKNERQTADVVRQLNCSVLWANGTRLSGCADVYAILDAQAQRDGVPIP